MAKLVAGVAFINKERKVLTIANRAGSQVFIGGKIEEKEEPLDALRRELLEELPNAKVTALWYYGSFSGRNNRGEMLTIYIFTGEVEGDLTPGTELTGHDVKWVGFEEYEGSEVMERIMARLKNDGYVV